MRVTKRTGNPSGRLRDAVPGVKLLLERLAMSSLIIRRLLAVNNRNLVGQS